ncbi:hypothetical protein L873DRAFT_1154771 [Choiromyces venosus 120613-1]|uniref:Uncharacterized protein n=1 Tax=Choiromyces venosus 120613-1 TaxID=1336337 RepID=A0A3N4JG38_9PEZI|nr:hypothetical protein L873DRAFT_914005 [Choiromyces venosus 120613-1]RPA97193.1 hypothetical protein L873DRAFT_1154771 [Choiromyces venosus 120613-1]
MLITLFPVEKPYHKSPFKHRLLFTMQNTLPEYRIAKRLATSATLLNAFEDDYLYLHLRAPHVGIAGRLGIVSENAGRNPLICEIKEVIVGIDEEVEAIEVDKEKEDLVLAGVQGMGVMRITSMGKILLKHTVKEVGAALVTWRVGELMLALFAL